MSTVVNDFEKIKIEYELCPDFCDIYAILIDGSTLRSGWLYTAQQIFF